MGSVLPAPFVSQASKQDSFRLLDGFLDLGLTAFDTAALYQAGGTERLLGEWQTDRRNRDRLFLITKGGHPNVVFNSSRFSAAAVAEDLHGSLRRLRTDHIDLYLLHRDDPSRPVDEVIGLLARFQREGKIRAYGVSNWSVERIDGAVGFARDRNLPIVAVNSPHYSLLDWVTPPWPGCVSLAGNEARAARAYHTRTQLPVLAWSSLGHGFFSDRLVENTRPGLLDLKTRAALDTYGSPANFARRARATEVGQKHGMSAAQIALAYLFHQPFPVFAVVASSTAEKMKRNVVAAGLSLTPDEIRFLEQTT